MARNCLNQAIALGIDDVKGSIEMGKDAEYCYIRR